MVRIGNMPIILHIMKHYSFYGHNEFIICGGYKINAIKDYFLNFNNYNLDFTIQIDDGNLSINHHGKLLESGWKISVVNTGEVTNTGGRIKKIQNFVGLEDFFCTYGDGLSDVNINELLRYRSPGRVWVPARSGRLRQSGCRR